MKTKQEKRKELFLEIENNPPKDFNDPIYVEYQQANKEAVSEFLSQIDFKPLTAYVKNLVDADLCISINDIKKIHIEMISQELLPKMGLMNLSFESVKLETFNSSVCTDNEEISYWGSLNFRYKLLEGGSNSSNVLYMWYKDGYWKVRSEKDGVLCTLDKKGNPSPVSCN